MSKPQQQQQKVDIEKAIADYKPRPENSVPSRKKDQRHAEEARLAIRERKRVKAFQEKQKDEEARKTKRLELFDRLKATSLDKETRDELSSSSMLVKPIANVQREAGKTGERQRRQDSKKKKKAGGGAASVTVIQQQDDSSSSDEEEEEEVVEPKRAVVVESAPVDSSSSSDEEEEEEEEEATPAPVPAPTPAALAATVAAVVTTPAFVVSPVRTAEVDESRSKLTIVSMEQEIMEQINEHDVVFVCGDTGCGKTTQVPQMLLEAGFGCTQHPLFPGMVAVTQPRRFAAVSVAERVGVELGAPVIDRNHQKKMMNQLGNRHGTESKDLAGCVGYQIRHDQTTCHAQSTRIKFMTDGILLAELKEDFLLRQYSTVVMDEVHERGLNSDLLLGLLSRIVPMRRKMYEEDKSSVLPLKLVIMSATMVTEDFQSLGFASAPVISVSGARQFSVTPHFAKRTEQIDYLNATFRKCCQVHEKLPSREGGGDGILVFLTGQREIEWFCRKLREKYNDERFAGGGDGDDGDLDGAEAEEALELAPLMEDEDDDGAGNDSETKKQRGGGGGTRLVVKKRKVAKRTKGAAGKDAEEEEEEPDESELSGLEDEEEAGAATAASNETAEVHVVPLFSRLSADKQKRVFQQIPAGKRLIVVATNVAETSLTIPNIRYVVDSGREKRRVYDQRSGTSSFRVEFISQSSAKQRMGRAGRVSTGHCYRLYSTAVYENLMDAKSLPETSNVPIDDLVLYMKNLGMDNIVDFPFPSKLDPVAIHNSLTRLQQLGALATAATTKQPQQLDVTPLGAQMAKLPVSVRVAKTLTLCANEPKCSHTLMPHCVALCALLSLPSPFEVSPKTNFRGDASSDALCLLRAAGAYSHTPEPDRAAFCDQFGLNLKTMKESEQLAQQLARRVNIAGGDGASRSTMQMLDKLPVLPSKFESLLKQAVIAGLIDHVAKRVLDGSSSSRKLKPTETPYVSCDANLHGQHLYLHPHSVLLSDADHDLFQLPEYVCYTAVSAEGRMEGCTRVEAEWLRALSFGTVQCREVMLTTPEPVYDAKQDAVFAYIRPEFGSAAWALPIERRPLEVSASRNKDARLVAQTFARSLMEGKVVGALVSSMNQWIDPPAHCTRAPFQPRVVKLVSRLVECQVYSKSALAQQLAKDGAFLLPELSAWIKASAAKAELDATWKQLAKQAKDGTLLSSGALASAGAVSWI